MHEKKIIEELQARHIMMHTYQTTKHAILLTFRSENKFSETVVNLVDLRVYMQYCC